MMDRVLDSKTMSDAIDMGGLITRLRRTSRELRSAVSAARDGIGLLALEDRIILEEINYVLKDIGLQVVLEE